MTEKLELRNFVGGEHTDTADGRRMDLVDPSSGEVFGSAPVSGPEDVDRAYAAAAGAFETWRDVTPAERVSDVAQTTFEHVYEVDPRLMQRHVLQQVFPNWDTLRIMRSRHDHLAWMHRHFAEKVVAGSSILEELEREAGAAQG